MMIWGVSVSITWLLGGAVALLAFGFFAGRQNAKLRASRAFVRLMLEEAITATGNPDLLVYEDGQGPVRRYHVISGAVPLLDPNAGFRILSVVRVDFYDKNERGPFGEFVLTFENGKKVIYSGNRPFAMMRDAREYLVLHCSPRPTAISA